MEPSGILTVPRRKPAVPSCSQVGPNCTQLYPAVPAVPNCAGWDQVDCYSVLGFRLNDASLATGQGLTLLMLMTQETPWGLNLTRCEVNYVTESATSDYSR